MYDEIFKLNKVKANRKDMNYLKDNKKIFNKIYFYKTKNDRGKYRRYIYIANYLNYNLYLYRSKHYFRLYIIFRQYLKSIIKHYLPKILIKNNIPIELSINILIFL